MFTISLLNSIIFYYIDFTPSETKVKRKDVVQELEATMKRDLYAIL